MAIRVKINVLFMSEFKGSCEKKKKKLTCTAHIMQRPEIPTVALYYHIRRLLVALVGEPFMR